MLSFESPVRTIWHRVPVIWKFLGLCLTSICLFIFDALQIQILALLFACALYSMGGFQFFKTGARRLWFLWPFLLIILVWHGLTGTAIQGVSIALRLLSIVALSNLMTMTSRLSDLLALIQGALKPIRALGIRTKPLEVAVALVVRFAPVLLEKGGVLLDAWRARSMKRAGWRIVFPLTLVAIDDAEQVAEALKARGGTQTAGINTQTAGTGTQTVSDERIEG